MKVSDCKVGQKVWRGSVYRSLDYGKPWYTLNEFTVVSPELSVVESHGSTHVVKEVFMTKDEAIQHMVSQVAGYISELENITVELRAKQLEQAA